MCVFSERLGTSISSAWPQGKHRVLWDKSPGLDDRSKSQLLELKSGKGNADKLIKTIKHFKAGADPAGSTPTTWGSADDRVNRLWSKASARSHPASCHSAPFLTKLINLLYKWCLGHHADLHKDTKWMIGTATEDPSHLETPERVCFQRRRVTE